MSSYRVKAVLRDFPSEYNHGCIAVDVAMAGRASSY